METAQGTVEKTKLAQLFGGNRKIRRVGLISPCSGNLGNAAILSSIIESLRLRLPDVEIIGITLSPEDTNRRHGIRGFPIGASSNGSYPLQDWELFAKGEHGTCGSPSSIRESLRRISWLRRLVRAVRTVPKELAHIIRSAQLLRTLDRVVIAGGGALDDYWGGPWGHPWTLLKFAALSRVFGVPFIYLSVGLCSLHYPLSRWFVGWSLRLAQYRSFRDQGSQTASEAQFHGISSAVWPDLAYGYSLPHMLVQRKDRSRDAQLRIAVNPIAFLDPRVWPVKDEQRYRRYFDQLVQVLKRLMWEGHRLTLFTTDGIDAQTSGDLRDALEAELSYAGQLTVLPDPPEQTCEVLLQNLCDADVVIASRLHGVILCHLIALPVVAISFDRKVDVHMNEIGQSDYCMSIDSFTSDTLSQRLTSIVHARELESEKIRCAVQANRRQVATQYDLLFGPQSLVSAQDQNCAQSLTQVHQ